MVILSFFSLCLLSAQKEYKAIKNYIKNGGNIATVNTVVQKCQRDEDFRDDPELYFLAAQAQRKLNDAENLKLYIKQAYDTVSFFSSIKGMFDYCIKCDSLDSKPDDKGRVRLKYRSKSFSMLCNYYPNLYSAGLFYIQKRNYKNAAPYFQMFLDAVDNPIFAKDKSLRKDPKRPRAAFWAMTSSFALQDFQGVFKYDSLAMQDSANTDLYLQYRALAYAGLKDSAHYESELVKGLRKMPSDPFFFSHLSDYYNLIKNYNKALSLADSMSRLHPSQTIFRFAKSVALYNMKNYDSCIVVAKQVVEKDSTNTDAYFYVGSSCYIKAVQMEAGTNYNINSKAFSKKKNEIKELYADALPYLERYRKLAPNETQRWAPLLYRTYLLLNKGNEFAEMEKILSQADAAKDKK